MKKNILYTILWMSNFFCVTSVYAGDMSGFEESFRDASITGTQYIILFVSMIAYFIFLINFCSKRKLKQTKKLKKELNKTKKWIYIFSCLIIFFSIATNNTAIILIVGLIDIIIATKQNK